jgi:hypothetical protein
VVEDWVLPLMCMGEGTVEVLVELGVPAGAQVLVQIHLGVVILELQCVGLWGLCLQVVVLEGIIGVGVGGDVLFWQMVAVGVKGAELVCRLCRQSLEVVWDDDHVEW